MAISGPGLENLSRNRLIGSVGSVAAGGVRDVVAAAVAVAAAAAAAAAVVVVVEDGGGRSVAR